MEVDSSDEVHAEIARLSAEGLFTQEEMGTTCCFATQDKVWVNGPGGHRWEIYTKLADSETFFAPEPVAEGARCCGAEVGCSEVGGRRTRTVGMDARRLPRRVALVVRPLPGRSAGIG